MENNEDEFWYGNDPNGAGGGGGGGGQDGEAYQGYINQTAAQ